MKYRNKFEEKVAEEIAFYGLIPEYELKKIHYKLENEYIPDFEIKLTNGSSFFLETKGNGRSFDAHARRKMIAVRDQHPDLDIRILFYSDGKIGAKRKDGTRMTQMEWAKKHGFTAAVRNIPKSWME